MEKIRNHKELRVYQLAYEAALEIHQLTKNFPPEEKYSFEYIDHETHDKLYDKYEHILAMLINISNQPEKWVL